MSRLSVRSGDTSWGVSVARAETVGANADTTSETGALIVRGPFSPSQLARMDRESLPTGIARPSSLQSSSPTARTVSYSRASSAGSPQAAIQLADRRTSVSLSIRAAARLVIASPTAMRPEAGASISATGLRSPMAMASPVSPVKAVVVTATSATGTCQGPTIWSRAVIPPTLRSPIVIRKDLLATVGSWSTRSKASAIFTPLRSQAASVGAACCASRCMRGVRPSSTPIGISTGRAVSAVAASPSSTTRLGSAVARPTIA